MVGFQIKIPTELFLVEPDFCFTTVVMLDWILRRIRYKFYRSYIGNCIPIGSWNVSLSTYVTMVYMNCCLSEIFPLTEIILSILEQLAFFPKRSEP